MEEKLFKILTQVTKPSRYIGAEVNSCVKDAGAVDVRFALCFPDVYEVGISHLGLKVLYEALNGRSDVYAERAYCPWPDMEEKLVSAGMQLCTLETGTPLSMLDVVGFTLQYELSYTNVLAMLALSGIPLRSTERDDEDPLVIAGGPCAFNPEPLAHFMDAFVIGDAEEAVLDVADAVKAHKLSGRPGGRAGLLEALSGIDGVYVPSHFEVVKNADGTIEKIRNIAGGKDTVTKRTVSSLDRAAYPARPILPYIAAVHNRVALEVARGCTRGCRFCQAGYIYRPLRERTPETLMRLAEEAVCATGYEELSLSSLSTGDYSCLLPLMKSLMDRYEGRRVSISLPSLRVGTLTPEICREIKRVRKTGFTIAPEAGTQRLRDVINKNVTEASLIETAETVFREGWDLVKLYFMVGLPTETDLDVEGIIELARKVLDAGRRAGGRRKMVNVGVSAFVPKPHTPFQWMGQAPYSEIRRKKDILARTLGRKPFALKTGLAEMSMLEAAFARGGRELGDALENAYRMGARFDGWSERFDYNLWKDAFGKAGLDLDAEAARSFGLDEVLPWDHIDTGVTKKYLKKELGRAMDAALTPDCRVKCTGCGLKCELDKNGAAVYKTESSPLPHPLPRGWGGGECMHPPSPYNGGGTKGGGALPTARVRIRYTKLIPLALLSHTELMNVFFRAISRAKIPIAFSEGFNPHAKVSFGPALAVGVESEAEILDMELSYAIDLKNLVKSLNAALPAEIRITEARVLRPKEPAAGGGLTRYHYEALAPDETPDVGKAVERLLSSGNAFISRVSDKGAKEIDIRPYVRDMKLVDERRVSFTLQEVDGRTAKPFEVAQALFNLPPSEARSVRLKRVGME